MIPKLYYSSIDKEDVPYLYEIIEKIDGVSLYNVWHTFNEEQREDIIRQLCIAMRQIHSHIGNRYNWTNKIKKQFMYLYEKVKTLNIFKGNGLKLLNHAYSKFDKYLESRDFVLIHNDLHFDNIFYKDGKIKIIDFERSMYAPRDFELDIFYRMIRKSRELMDFMYLNIEYGWIDKLGEEHINNLKGFRENYRISSIDEILETGFGTCIEQAKLIKLCFDRMGYENKLYCCRSYEAEDNFDEDVRMHCFVLFKDNNSWYHFEHSSYLRRGIHKYET